jgi:hypothetical protein
VFVLNYFYEKKKYLVKEKKTSPCSHFLQEKEKQRKESKQRDDV